MRFRFRRRFLLAILVAASAGVGLGVLSLSKAGERASAAPPAAVPRAAAPVASVVRGTSLPGVASASAVEGPPRPAVLAAAPPGVGAAQWQQLREQLLQQPGGAAELQRVADFLAYQDTLRRFRRLHSAGAGSEELRQTASVLDAGLAQRLQRNELSLPEARLVKLAVLDVLQPDDDARRSALARWDASVAAPPRPDPREQAFEREQAALVARWSAQPQAQRDPAQLQRELDALRRRSFAASSP
jgi:hypothetical protein